MRNSKRKDREAQIKLELKSSVKGDMNCQVHISGQSSELVALMVTVMEKEEMVERLLRDSLGYLEHTRKITQNN